MPTTGTGDPRLILQNLEPLPGYCIIVPETQELAVQDGIVIPDKALAETGNVGTVIHANPQEDQYDQAAMVLQERVLMRAGIGREYTYRGMTFRVYPLNQILAVLDDGAVAKVTRTDVPRCKFCKSDNGEGNLIILNKTCPKCGRDERGDIPAAREKFITPEQNEAFDDTARRRRMQVKGQIISYPGQRKRSV